MRLWHAAAAESAAMPLPVCNDRLLYVPALIIQICLRIYRLFAGSANLRRMGSCINKALLLTIAFWLLAILSLFYFHSELAFLSCIAIHLIHKQESSLDLIATRAGKRNKHFYAARFDIYHLEFRSGNKVSNPAHTHALKWCFSIQYAFSFSALIGENV